MSIFNRATDLPTLKADRLMGIATQYFPGGALPSDDELWFKLLSAETSLEHRFRTLFGVREVYGEDRPPPDLATLQANGTPTIVEPGYDFDPGFFSAEMWGLIELRHKPVVQVHEVAFSYPGPADSLYVVPNSWIRAEKKYGRINVVPGTQGSVTLPVNAFIISALSGGRTIPLMIKVRYQAGMPNIRTERPDIIDAIFRMAVLGVLDDQFFPSSDSSTIDGLSQNMSLDTQKYRDLTDKRLDEIGRSLSGIRMMVL